MQRSLALTLLILLLLAALASRLLPVVVVWPFGVTKSLKYEQDDGVADISTNGVWLESKAPISDFDVMDCS